jgi:Glycosyltransferase family 87
MILNEHRKDLLGFAYLALVGCIAIGFLHRTTIGAITGVLFFHRTPGGYAFNDYVAFYTAGKIVLSNMRSSIYDPAVQSQFYNQTIAPWSPGFSVKEIPLGQSVPWFFTLMAPFALVPIVISFALWNLVGGGLSILGLWALLKQQARDARFIRIFIIGMLGCYPVQWLIRDGQNSWLLLAPLCLFLYGWFAKKDIPGGAGLACLIIKPQYLLFMAVPALACKKWKLLAAATVFASLHVLCALKVFGLPTLISYPAMLKATESSNPAVFPSWMISLRGPMSIFMPTEKALMITTILYGVTLLAVIAFWWLSARKASEQKVRIAFAITLLACLLTSPHTHIYDFVIFAAVAACTMQAVEWFKASDLPQWSRSWCHILILLPFSTFMLYIVTDKIPLGEIVGLWMFILDLWLFVVACRWYASPETEAKTE